MKVFKKTYIVEFLIIYSLCIIQYSSNTLKLLWMVTLKYILYPIQMAVREPQNSIVGPPYEAVLKAARDK